MIPALTAILAKISALVIGKKLGRLYACGADLYACGAGFRDVLVVVVMVVLL